MKQNLEMTKLVVSSPQVLNRLILLELKTEWKTLKDWICYALKKKKSFYFKYLVSNDFLLEWWGISHTYTLDHIQLYLLTFIIFPCWCLPHLILFSKCTSCCCLVLALYLMDSVLPSMLPHCYVFNCVLSKKVCLCPNSQYLSMWPIWK